MAEVEVTPTRFIFKIGNNWTESVLIPYINVLSFKRDPKWGYLATGILFFMFALILHLAPYTPNTIILEKYNKEAFTFLSLFGGIVFTIFWLILRSFALELYSFGYKAKFVSRKEKNLKELFTTLETLRSQNFELGRD